MKKTKTKPKHRKKGGLFSWFTRKNDQLKNEPLKNEPLKNEQNYTKHIGFVEHPQSTDANSFQNRSFNMPVNRSNKFLNIKSYKEGEHLMDPRVIPLQTTYDVAEKEWSDAKDASEDYPLNEKLKMDLQNAMKKKDLAFQNLDRAQKQAFTEWKKTKTNIAVKSVETNQVHPKIVVLPCLQETKKGGLMLGYEYEQQPGQWDPVKRVIIPLFSDYLKGSLNASDSFNRFWKTGVIPENIKVKVTKNGLLEIPNCSSYGFTGACKQLNCMQKWKMYAQYFNHMQNRPNAALIVTHHNRMRNSKDSQGLLPFKQNGNYGYANNFCLKIEVVEGKVRQISVFERGFPDKGSFEAKGNSGYTYLDSIDNIDLAPITEGIQEGLMGTTLNITMYMIRHGNALHNKPMNLSGSSKRLDSTLTPLGMLQASILGKKFESELEGKSVVLCSSFLQRTQMTGLLLLEKANQLPNVMKDALITMKRQAYIRYNQSGFNKGFDNYAPLNEPLNEGNQEYTNILNNILSESLQMVGGKHRKTRKHLHKDKYKRN